MTIIVSENCSNILKWVQNDSHATKNIIFLKSYREKIEVEVVFWQTIKITIFSFPKQTNKQTNKVSKKF